MPVTLKRTLLKELFRKSANTDLPLICSFEVSNSPAALFSDNIVVYWSRSSGFDSRTCRGNFL